jgi:hypothetical protein
MNAVPVSWVIIVLVSQQLRQQHVQLDFIVQQDPCNQEHVEVVIEPQHPQVAIHQVSVFVPAEHGE